MYLNHSFGSDKTKAFPSFLICQGKGTVLDICSCAGVLYLIPAMSYVPPQSPNQTSVPAPAPSSPAAADFIYTHS